MAHFFKKLFYMSMIPIYHTLSNGLRIVHLKTDSPIGYCGFAVNAGTRDEEANEFGLAHFVEHTLFKGTQKRKAWQILNRMETVGGELNAYTSKEETFIYSIFIKKDFNRAIELLSDLIANSRFPETELKKEREVILEEINTYEDNPSDLIFDDFENLIYKDHALGHHILGNKKSLRSFNTKISRSFIDRFYNSENMIFFSMADIEIKQILRFAEKYLNTIPKRTYSQERIKPLVFPATQTIKKRKTYLSHVVIGGVSYNMFDKKKYSLHLINTILGGGMNSRLNVNLREKNGLVYTVESNITSYTDTGTFTIYFGIDKKNRDKAIHIVDKEIKSLRETSLSDIQLKNAKKQAIGQMCISAENKENISLALGKAFLHFNKFEALEDILQKINDVTKDEIIETANEVLAPSNLSTLIYE
jgi:predicted Zn-dependent peptidase